MLTALLSLLAALCVLARAADVIKTRSISIGAPVTGAYINPHLAAFNTKYHYKAAKSPYGAGFGFGHSPYGGLTGYGGLGNYAGLPYGQQAYGVGYKHGYGYGAGAIGGYGSPYGSHYGVQGSFAPTGKKGYGFPTVGGAYGGSGLYNGAIGGGIHGIGSSLYLSGYPGYGSKGHYASQGVYFGPSQYGLQGHSGYAGVNKLAGYGK